MTGEADNKPEAPLKCPKCGKVINTMATRCLCGHELNGVQASKVIEKLVAKFDELEAQLDQQGLTGSAREKESKQRRARLIRDLPIPNARLDLQSLIYFIYPKIQDNSQPDPNIEDWRVKFKEVMGLAKQAYRDDAKVRAELEDMERSLTLTLSGVVQSRAKRNPIMMVGLLIALVAILISVANTLYGKWEVAQCEKQYEQSAHNEKERLTSLVAQITAKNSEKNYLDAKSAANNLLWGLKGSCKITENERAKNVWDEKRKELLTQITANEAADQAQKDALENQKVAAERAEADKIAQEKRAIEAKEAARKSAQQDRLVEDSLRQRARDAATRNR